MCLMLAASLTEPTILETIGDWSWRILGVGAGLTFVIFVHELGHFLVAKACGVKCEKFYVGFDFFELKLGPFKIPRALIKFQWGETEYGLGSLPLGGYVKMLGQDDDPRNAEAESERIKSLQEGTAAEGLVPGQTVEGKPILLDPRSYPAKSVPARMAIISAGVIMNLIFGVILAAVAFKLGVKETPAIVGGTTPGGPAWVKNVEPGSKVLQIGKRGSPYEFLRFEDFRITAILNKNRDVPMLIRRPNGEEQWYDLKPMVVPGSKFPMIGMTMPRDRKANIYPKLAAHLNPRSSVPLKDFDLVVEVAGQKVTSGEDLATIFAQQPLGPISIKFERQAESAKNKTSETAVPPQTISAKLEPRAMRDLGMTMKAGPIVAVREGSPAMQAGLLVDDLLVEIDGEPVGDPLSLSQRLTPQGVPADEVSIVVERKDKQGKRVKRTLKILPEPPLQSPTLITDTTSIESLGIAFKVSNEVAEVLPGGPAAAADLRRGDVITKVHFLPGSGHDEKAAENLSSLRNIALFKEIELTEGKADWPLVMFCLQSAFPESKAKLTWTRGEQTLTAELQPRDSTTYFDDTRGLYVYYREETHVATDWGDAFRLGLRETTERLKEVVVILHSLATGNISPTNLSGPAGIIYAAGSFASEGLPSLLMFLTILSANLAILNFLPIPALDGGHMLFLLAEWVRGKPVDEKLQIRLTIFGVICLLSLMVFATAMDIGRFAQMIQNLF